jgi:hypothetical protein
MENQPISDHRQIVLPPAVPIENQTILGHRQAVIPPAAPMENFGIPDRVIVGENLIAIKAKPKRKPNMKDDLGPRFPKAVSDLVTWFGLVERQFDLNTLQTVLKKSCPKMATCQISPSKLQSANPTPNKYT